MSVGSVQPFQTATNASTVTIAATTTVATAALPGNGESVLVYNASAAIAFVRVGGSATTATVNDVPVPPGARMLMQCGAYASLVAVLLSTGTGNVLFVRGSGTTY
jgi:hypothetical protein